MRIVIDIDTTEPFTTLSRVQHITDIAIGELRIGHEDHTILLEGYLGGVYTHITEYKNTLQEKHTAKYTIQIDA